MEVFLLYFLNTSRNLLLLFYFIFYLVFSLLNYFNEFYSTNNLFKNGFIKTFELFHPQDIQESYSALQSVLVFKTPKAVVN